MADKSDLERLTTITAQELTKLARDDDRRNHVRLLSELNGAIPAGMSWREIEHPIFTIEISPVKDIVNNKKMVFRPRSTCTKWHIWINAGHSDFLTRLEFGRQIGQQVVSYIANLVVSHYLSFRSGDAYYAQDTPSLMNTFVKTSCRIENAVWLKIQSQRAVR